MVQRKKRVRVYGRARSRSTMSLEALSWCLPRRWMCFAAAATLVMCLVAQHYFSRGFDKPPWMPKILAGSGGDQTRSALESVWAGIGTRSKDEKTSLWDTSSTTMGCMNLQNLDREKAVVLGHRKKGRGFMTIGITTVDRTNANYLQQTLSSLIENANSTERSKIAIVVFACDFKEQARQEARDIVSGFAEHVESGLLQLIEAPRSFYPPLDNIKRTFNNENERVQWRSKENIDNVFLFAYCAAMSDYYLQLDDDFTTVPGYVERIREFIDEHWSDHWVLLDISEKGTGKLFRDADLLHVGRYLVQFYQEQPVDFLFSALMQLHNQIHHYVVNPRIFKHMGNISSLDLKNKPRQFKNIAGY